MSVYILNYVDDFIVSFFYNKPVLAFRNQRLVTFGLISLFMVFFGLMFSRYELAGFLNVIIIGVAILLFFVFVFSGLFSLTSENILIIMFTIALLFPFYRIKVGLPAIQIEQVVLFVAIIYNFSQKQAIKIKKSKFTEIDRLFFGFIAVIALSSANSAIFLDNPVVIRDVLELLKLGVYYGFFKFAYNLSLNEKMLKKILYFFIFASFLNIVFAISQYYNFFQINERLTIYYIFWESHLTKFGGEIIRGSRVGGSFVNPNDYGYFIIIVSSLILNILISKKSLIKKGYLVLIFILGFLFFSLTLASSRTTVLALIILVPEN